ncbi:hypothetical protein V8C43DRAFT_298161 [Trichoderma afarasin]
MGYSLENATQPCHAGSFSSVRVHLEDTVASFYGEFCHCFELGHEPLSPLRGFPRNTMPWVNHVWPGPACQILHNMPTNTRTSNACQRVLLRTEYFVPCKLTREISPAGQLGLLPLHITTCSANPPNLSRKPNGVYQCSVLVRHLVWPLLAQDFRAVTRQLVSCKRQGPWLRLPDPHAHGHPSHRRPIRESTGLFLLQTPDSQSYGADTAPFSSFDAVST